MSKFPDRLVPRSKIIKNIPEPAESPDSQPALDLDADDLMVDTLTKEVFLFWKQQPAGLTEEYDELMRVLGARSQFDVEDYSRTQKQLLPWEFETDRLMQHFNRLAELEAHFSHLVPKTVADPELAGLLLHSFDADLQAAVEAVQCRLVAESLQDITFPVGGHRLNLAQMGLIDAMVVEKTTKKGEGIKPSNEHYPVVLVYLKLSETIKYRKDLITPITELFASTRLIDETSHLPFHVWFCWPETDAADICLINSGRGVSDQQKRQLKLVLQRQYDELFSREQQDHEKHLQRLLKKCEADPSIDLIQSLMSGWAAAEATPGGVRPAMCSKALEKLTALLPEYLKRLEEREFAKLEQLNIVTVSLILAELVDQLTFMEKLGVPVSRIALKAIAAVRKNQSNYQFLLQKKDGRVLNDSMRKLIELKN